MDCMISMFNVTFNNSLTTTNKYQNVQIIIVILFLNDQNFPIKLLWNANVGLFFALNVEKRIILRPIVNNNKNGQNMVCVGTLLILDMFEKIVVYHVQFVNL